MGTVVKEKDGRYRVRIRRKVRGVIVDKSARFERLTDARKWDQQTETEITNGKFFKTAEAEQHTLNDVIDRYRNNLRLENPRRLKTVEHLLQWWGARLGKHLLADLTQAMIAEAMDNLRKETVPNRKKGLKYTNATVNRYKSALQSCLNMAVSPWCWMEDNPAKKIKNLKEPPGRDRFLKKEELVELLNQCRISENPYLHGIVVIALSSGARREEVRSMKWADVFLEEGKIILRKTKNKKNRTIHLAHHALAEIRKRHDAKGVLSKARFGHTFTTHGERATEFLVGRARGSGRPQGQFLNDQVAASFIEANIDKVASGTASIPVPLDFPARMIMPDGSFQRPKAIRLVPGGKGVKTAYPEL